MSCLGEKYRGRVWLPVAAFALIAVGGAGCSSDVARFSDFSNPFAGRSTEAPPPASRVESRPVAQAPLPPPPTNKPIAQAPVSRPVASASPAKHVHVVAAGDTLMKLSRRYGKPVSEIAKANNISAQSKLQVGARITVPGGRPVTVAAAPSPEPAPRPEPKVVASIEPQHTARIATPEPVQPESSTKTAEPAGGLPSFRWPVRGRVIAGFGPKTNGQQNDGINLAVPEGTPIKAAEDGVVAYAGNELKGYGNLVLIRHGGGFVSAYAHASEIMAKRGDQIKRGQVIARSGQTGNVTSPQLHFEIRKGATPVDPMQFLTAN
jgi:murein DD-endopeptidase MepM/ murein hydrolase activator NlpD